MKLIINNMIEEPEYIPSTVPTLEPGVKINLAPARKNECLAEIVEVHKVVDFDVVTCDREEFNLWKTAEVYELKLKLEYEKTDIIKHDSTYTMYIWR